MTNTNASMLLKFLISGNRGVCLGHAAAPRQHHFVDCHMEILSNSANDSMTLSLPIFLGPTVPLVLLSVGFCMSWFRVVLAMLHGFLIYSHYSLKFERIRHWNDIRSVRLCRTSDPSWWPREFHCGCCAATSYTFWQETLPSCHFCKRQMSKFDLELSWI